MPEAQVIDGKATAEKLRATLESIVKRLKKDHDLIPGLAVVMVGDDPASHIYTKNKVKIKSTITELGIPKVAPPPISFSKSS